MDKDNIYVLRDIDCFMSVTEAIREQGLTLENRIIEKKVIESNYYLSKQLNVPLATKLFYLCRVRYVEGIAQSIEKTGTTSRKRAHKIDQENCLNSSMDFRDKIC